MLQENYTLHNGVQIPKLGLGTWFINNKDVIGVIKNATTVGYRNFDTAQVYGNQDGVGEGIRTCGIPRKELFVSTKINPNKDAYENPDEVIDDILKTMDIEYLDLLLIHSPQPWRKYRGKVKYFAENKRLWKSMEKAYKNGKIKAIGVSNFLQEDLENLIEDCEIKPMVNQILMHISNTPFTLLEYCKQNNIIVQAHSPIAHGRAMKNKKIIAMASSYNISVPQLCIRYVIQHGAVAIPKTANIEHMKSNADIDFTISKTDMDTLDKLKPLGYGLLKLFPVYNGK